MKISKLFCYIAFLFGIIPTVFADTYIDGKKVDTFQIIKADYIYVGGGTNFKITTNSIALWNSGGGSSTDGSNAWSWVQLKSNDLAYLDIANNFTQRIKVNNSNVVLQGEITPATWGLITGSLNNQTDLWSYISNAPYLSSNNTYSAGTIQAFALATITNNASSGTDIVNYRTATNLIATLSPAPTLQSVLNAGNTATNSMYIAHTGTGDATINIGTNSGSWAKFYVKGVNGLLTNVPLVLIEGSAGRNASYLLVTGNSGTTTNFDIQKDGTVVINRGKLRNEIGAIYTPPIITNGIYIAITNVASINFTNFVDRNNYAMYGRLFISTTNNGPVDISANLSFYNSSNRVGDNVRWRTTNNPVRLYLQQSQLAIPSGTTNLIVPDSSGFAINNLVYLCGSNEFVRISNILTTNLILESPTLYGHILSGCVSRVSEYQTRVFNKDFTSNVCGMLSFSGTTTINIVSNVVEAF